MLPNTPPKGNDSNATASSALGTEAFVLFKDRPTSSSLLRLFWCAFHCHSIMDLPMYFNELGMENAAEKKMILGQVSEAVLFLLFLSSSTALA